MQNQRHRTKILGNDRRTHEIHKQTSPFLNWLSIRSQESLLGSERFSPKKEENLRMTLFDVVYDESRTKVNKKFLK